MAVGVSRIDGWTISTWPGFAGEKSGLCLTERFEICRPNACASDQNQRCAPAQPEESPRRTAAGETGRHYRVERLGQIVARVRHVVCRGAATLRREPFRLRPAVPRPN